MSNFDYDNASWTDLRIQAKHLDEELKTVNNKVAAMELAFSNLSRKHGRASEIVQELISDKVITDSDVLRGLCENLNVEATRVVSFTLNATITGSVEIGYDEDPDDYGFEVIGLYYNGDKVNDYYEDSTSVEWDEE